MAHREHADRSGSVNRFFARPWIFVTSAPAARYVPPEGPAEIAFAGRSNVGKSSLINALCGQGGLARTSNTPGRTQALNFFVPEESATTPDVAIVDMPGYGFARAPKATVADWTRLVFSYLRGRPSLKRVFVLVDSRHGIKKSDTVIFDLLDKAAVSYQIVLTKADKPSAAALEKTIAATRASVARRPAAHPDILAVSALKGEGIDRLRNVIFELVTH